MGEDADPELSAILGQLDLRPDIDLDLSEAGPALVGFLTAVATYLNTLAVGEFGGRQGPVRQAGLVEQVVGAALQTFAEVDPHPGPFAKAAMLLRGITAGHPFHDGNKRTGFLLATFYLEHHGYPLPESLSVSAAEDLCVRISAGELRDVEEIERRLHRLWQGEAGE